MPEATTLELFVDPSCPWAWLTSRWLSEVERVRPIRVRTRLFDLAEINRGREDERHRQSHAAGERAMRTLVLARRQGGDGALRHRGGLGRRPRPAGGRRPHHPRRGPGRAP